MPRPAEYPDPPDAVPGLGLPLAHASLAHRLVEPAPGEDPVRPTVGDWEGRILHIVDDTRYGRDQFWDRERRHFDIDQNWHHIPFEVLRDHFTTDELCRAVFKSVVMSEISQRFAKDPAYIPLDKVQNSLYQYGRESHRDYRTVVGLYRGLARFDFGVPGFTAHFDHTDWECGSEGHARYGRHTVEYKNAPHTVRQWLDGAFAYQIAKGGEPVLTVGFSLAATGVLVSQIQVRGRTKGNRWLYRLTGGLREHVVGRLRAAWPDFPVRLITGETQKAYSRYTHRSRPQDYPDEVADRVAGFYDAPLAGYRPGDVAETHAGWGPRRDFRELVPVTQPTRNEEFAR